MMYDDLKDCTPKELAAIAKEYIQADEYDEALDVLKHLLNENMNDPEGIFLTGCLYVEVGNHGLAYTYLRRASELMPERAEVWSALGTCADLVNTEESIAAFEAALRINPKATTPMVNLAGVEMYLGNFERAISLCAKAILIDPDSIAAHDIRGLSFLALENYERGWADHELSLGAKFRKEIIFGNETRWNGLGDQRVIVYGEQGLGDEIMFASCLEDMMKYCEVIVECDPKLEGLFKRSFPEATVYGTRNLTASWPKYEEYDARCSIGSLPYYFRKYSNSFPGTPYLKADPIRRKQWRTTLDDMGDKPKVGIAWRGGGKFTCRKDRAIPLEYFEPLFEVADVINLEYEKADTGDYPIHTFSHATLTRDYDDTAALVAELDYVVATTTTINHLCGALGVPCHVLVEKHPNWRWIPDKMVWHDSIVIHRGDWKKIIQEIANADIRGISQSVTGSA